MQEITLVKDAVHRPDEPRHFMEYAYPKDRYVARIGDTVIADSSRVLKLSEVAYHIYDPVIYFPLSDVHMDMLNPASKTTHCPLKGDTQYFDFDHAGTAIEHVAWCYAKPLSFAETLRDYLAFDGRLVGVAKQ